MRLAFNVLAYLLVTSVASTETKHDAADHTAITSIVGASTVAGVEFQKTDEFTNSSLSKKHQRVFVEAIETLQKYQAYINKQQKKHVRRGSPLKVARDASGLLPRSVRPYVQRIEWLASWLFGDKEKNAAAYRQKQLNEKPEKVKQAVATMKELASEGSEDAQLVLADMAMYGKYGTNIDLGSAFEHYKKLAEANGNPKAQYMLGLFYATGLGGIEQRNSMALLYNTMAAKSGYTPAEMTLAYKFLTGIGVPASCKESLVYYKSVARKGILYYLSGPPLGYHIPPYRVRLSDDNKGAYGVHTGPYSLYKVNDREGFEELLNYHLDSARKGDLRSCMNLIDLYYHGHRFASRNFTYALKYIREVISKTFTKRGDLQKGLSQGEVNSAAQAAGMYGMMYLRGEGVTVDTAAAFKWLTIAANMGHGTSLNALGVMYQHGIEVPVNNERALELFKAAAEKKHQSGQVNFAVAIMESQPQVAVTNLRNAAENGNILAHFHLGGVYSALSDTEISCRMAVSSYKYVAEYGDWLHSSIPSAYAAYERGDLDAAVLEYMRAAEMGYGVGQLNAALLLERAAKLCSYRDWDIRDSHAPLESGKDNNAMPAWSNRSCVHSVFSDQQQHERQTLAYWTRAANNNMADARAKQGDHYYYGWGVEASAEKAAAAYLISAKSDANGLAMWNLGWMYENGVGVKRDFFLAKRWYDKSIEVNEGGKLATNFSLARLFIKYLWAWVWGEDVGETPLYFAPETAAADDGKNDEDDGEKDGRRETEADDEQGGAQLRPLGHREGNEYVPEDWEHEAGAAAAEGLGVDDTAAELDENGEGSLSESVFIVVLLLAAAWMFLPFR